MPQGQHERRRPSALDKLRKRRAKSKPSKAKRQPLLVATATVLVSWLALKFGVPIDDNTADAIAGFLVLVAIPWVHSKVTPVAAPTLPAEAVPDLEVTGATTAQVQALLATKGIS